MRLHLRDGALVLIAGKLQRVERREMRVPFLKAVFIGQQMNSLPGTQTRVVAAARADAVIAQPVFGDKHRIALLALGHQVVRDVVDARSNLAHILRGAARPAVFFYLVRNLRLRHNSLLM